MFGIVGSSNEKTPDPSANSNQGRNQGKAGWIQRSRDKQPNSKTKGIKKMDTEKFNMGWLIVSLETLKGRAREQAKKELQRQHFGFLIKGRRALMVRSCVRRSLKTSGQFEDWAAFLQSLGLKFWFTCRAAWEHSYLRWGADEGPKVELPPTTGGKILLITDGNYSFVDGAQRDLETLTANLIKGKAGWVKGILIA